MKRFAKADSDNAQNATSAGAQPTRRMSKGKRKRARAGGHFRPVGNRLGAILKKHETA